MNLFLKKIKSFDFYFAILLVLILLRAIFNAFIPLMDKTEARYGEIARIMAETNNWIVLQIDYGVPFWAKPPLSSWLSALSISVFGSGEFFVRLPYLFLSLIMIFLVCKFLPKESKNKLVPGLILMSLPEFFIHAGVVSTDVPLSFSIAIVFLSFWKWLNTGFNQKWIYLFFIGLGLGLLAKGPIALIITLPPLFFWFIRFKFSLNLLFRIEILFGIIIFSIIAIPWYYLVEVNSPGFIDYFLFGEHFRRFFDSQWSGDKYGFPKSQPIGIIWGFLIIFTIPWITYLILKVISNIKSIWNDKWRLFLLFWLVWTPLFFSPSKSLIHPYILPVMTPIALLISSWWEEMKNKNLYISLALIFPLLSFFLFIFGLGENLIKNNTDKFLIKKINVNETLFSFNEKSYSSQYYSAGKIKMIDKDALDSILEINKPFSILINNNDIKKIRNKDKFILLDKNTRKGIYRFSKINN